MKPLSFLIFLGSFVSFALEPMIGRTLLPAFGGTPSVWVTCLAAFQVLMVGGYFYAGKVRIKPHVALLLAAAGWCVYLGFGKRAVLSAVGGLTGIPAIDVLLSVTVLCGVTFILLSANATVVQKLSGGDYRLYAVSNAGSLCGLLAYPILIEPNVSVSAQWVWTGLATAVYAALLWKASRNPENTKDVRPETKDVIAGHRTYSQSTNRTFPFLLLPALTCALLNAVTSHLTLDVMPLPLLWAVLLALFLLSYIIGFSGWGERFVGLWGVLGVASTAFAAFFDYCPGVEYRLQLQFAFGGAAILFCSTCLHSYLYAIRPGEAGLPRYYLLNVIGGAVGGLLTGVVAPLVFNRIYEYPLMLAAVAAVVAVLMRGWKLRTVTAALAIATAGLTAMDTFWKSDPNRPMIHYGRGFFGTVSVQRTPVPGTGGVLHEFVHGNIVHGIQARIPGKERLPTCYYTRGAIGWAIAGHPKYRRGEPMRVNLVGMGVGVLFSYGRTNDYYRAYEISPDVVNIATNRELFSFVADCPAKTEIVVDDARKGLERERAAGVEKYDVIVVDAFTGDNVPYHLSSKEAFELYFDLLKPDGVLAVNISNKYVDMVPYAKKLSAELNVPLMAMETEADMARLGFGTVSAFFLRDSKGYASPPVGNGPGKAHYMDMRRVREMATLPTDEKGSFLELLEVW